ncbi:MAG: MlaD family protein [Gemmatimonadota bacterium]|nr:MlaD family protein [Gemmatimonadota bacterium]
MARSLAWGELKLGLIATIAVAASVFGILFFARVGQLRGDTSTLYVYTDEATGVLPGTEVWLSGEVIGQVKRVHYRPIATDTLRRLSIETIIIADRMRYIRRDSRVDIRPGGNLIGTPVINITGGTARAPALASGDTMATLSASPFKPLGLRVDSLMVQMNQLSDTAKKLAAAINLSQGTIGAFKKSGLPAMPKATETFDGLMQKATTGNGTIGLAMQNDLTGRFARLSAAKDSITFLLTSGNGTVGRFRKDSTLIKSVASVKSQVDSLKLMLSGKGTISRSRTDSALTKELARMSVELAALMADVKKNPTAYISF